MFILSIIDMIWFLSLTFLKFLKSERERRAYDKSKLTIKLTKIEDCTLSHTMYIAFLVIYNDNDLL